MNAIMSIARQLIEKTSSFSDLALRRLGRAEQIVATGGKFVTPDSGPLTGCAQESVGRTSEGKNPALSRRAEEIQTLDHAPSGLNSRKFAMLQLIDPPRTVVASGKA